MGALPISCIKIHRSSTGKVHPGGIHEDHVDWSCNYMRQLSRPHLQRLKPNHVSLDLSHNPLGELPIGIGLFSGLVHISLYDCDFSEDGIPQSFFRGLKNLEVLDVSCNYFTVISESFAFNHFS